MKKILIVDDIDAHSVLLKAILEKQGYECIQSSSAIDALCKVQSDYFDLILIDLAMPVMSGIDCIKYLKKMCNSPIVAVTGYSTVEIISEAKESGANDVWIKPISMPSVIEKVEKYWG